MKTKRILFTALFCIFVLSGCSNKTPADRVSGDDPNAPFMVEGFTQKDIANSHSNYSIMFPQPYTIEMYPGETRTEKIEIKNVGKKGDTFVFEGEYWREGNENEWVDFSTLTKATYLKSGKEMKLSFLIQIPEDAKVGSYIPFSIKALRESNKDLVGGTDIGIVVVEKK